MLLFKSSVIDRATEQHQHRSGGIAVAGLMLLLWLLTSAMAASPQLHELLHEDAQKTGHACVVTLMQGQTVLASSPTVMSPPMPITVSEVVPFKFSCTLPSSDYRLSPSRAPPSMLPVEMIAG